MSSRYTDPATKSDLDLLESKIKMKLATLAINGFLALLLVAAILFLIVAAATETKGGR